MHRFFPKFAALAALAILNAASAQDLAGHGGPVRALLVQHDRLISGGFDQAIIRWEPTTGRVEALNRWHQGGVVALAALPDGGLASAGEDGRVALWRGGLDGAPSALLEGATAPLTALAVWPDGTIAAAGFDAVIRLYRRDGTVEALAGHAGPVTALAIAVDGMLVSAGFDGTVRTWRDGAAPAVIELGWPQAALLALRDGSVAAGGADGVVRLLDPTGHVREVRAGERPVIALAVSPDGAVLAAAAAGGAVALLSVPSGRMVRTLEGPGLPVWSLAFSRDGAHLWTGGQDRLVRRWDVATGAALGPLAANAPESGPESHPAFRACVACHTLAADPRPMAGPHLGGILGRRMGAVAGYGYSARLAAADIVWTRESIARLFTEGPDVMLPGTRMPVQTIGDPAALADLLDLLERPAPR